MEMMLHIGRDGNWKRCIATEKIGMGCSDCPAVTGKVGPGRLHMSAAVVAATGGGTASRSDRDPSVISAVDGYSGMFTRGAEGKRQMYFDAETGENVPWKDRRNAEQIRTRARRTAVAMPNPDVVAVNSETPQAFRMFFDRIKNNNKNFYGGTEIKSYNHEQILNTLVGAQKTVAASVPAHIQNWPLADRRREQNEAMDMAVYFAAARGYDPETAIDSMLEKKRWGKYDPQVIADEQAEADRQARREAQKRALRAGTGEKKFRLNSYSTPVG